MRQKPGAEVLRLVSRAFVNRFGQQRLMGKMFNLLFRDVKRESTFMTTSTTASVLLLLLRDTEVTCDT